MAAIAFIGVGNMGGPMAINLVKQGHTVNAFDLSPALLQQVAAQGAKPASSAIEAVAHAEVVISMLPSGAIVEKLFLDETKLLEHVDKRALIIDCSTVAPENSRRVAAAAKLQGVAFIDAPVSGGVAGAQAGTLSFLCGGSSTDVERARPYLACMGKNIFHAGDVGAGSVAKICNNMLLAIHMIGTAEALQLGVDNGLDPKVLSDIMLKSSGRNWSLEVYNPYPGVMENAPASREYQGGFQVDLMNKDLSLAMDAALKSQSNTPMGSLARSLYAAWKGQGKGKLDFSSIQQLFQH
ncbi:MAG TPA: 3-hydroxyisobutyrate dehydrogenase [Pseudomonadales bacterium]|nr:3-hydroxyisobutyrate dehydrogenase [Pseudomonadales bacterium]